jgi:hypothetical protein
MKRFIWIIAGLIGGTVVGAALGYVDVLFLSSRVSFEQPHDYLSAGQLFVRYVPMALNAVFGCVFGALIGVLWTPRSPRKVLNNSGSLVDLVPWAISGAFLGTALGYLDIYALSQLLNLLNSDNAAAWRESRSYLPMINAAGGFLIGAVLGSAKSRNRATA